MKKLIAIMVIALCATSAQATVYNDNTGDTFFGGILDIVNVEVTDDGTDLTFKMTLVGDIAATNWGNYMYHIDTGPGGDLSATGNGWFRPISYAPDGADYCLGAWVNGSDAGGPLGWQHWTYSGGWNMDFQTNLLSLNQFDFSIKTSISGLGLSPGDSFCFDAYTSGTGGGDGAVDSLGNPAQQIANWGDQSNANPVCYTTTPEPTTLGLLALGGLILVRRRR